MQAVQNINLSLFTSIVVPVDTRHSVINLVEKINKSIKDKSKKPIIHLVSVVKNVNDYDLNRYLLQLNNHKNVFVDNNFIVTAEFIKISEGDEKITEAIVDYALRLESNLLVDETLLKNIDASKEDLYTTNSSILFI